MTNPQVVGHVSLKFIALGGIIQCPKGRGEELGRYISSTQDPQSLTRARQAVINERLLAQFYMR